MKEFKEMQIIWDSQNNEKLFAINEDALHESIQNKSKSLKRTLTKLDIIMIVVNIGVAVVLTIDIVRGSNPAYEFTVPIAYFVFVLIAFYRRWARQNEYQTFAPTLRGELDRAIWQVNYMIDQSHAMIWWYLVPLFLVISVTLALNGNFWLIGALFLVLFPLTYWASRWEVNKFYMPKKRELEALKQTLIESE